MRRKLALSALICGAVVTAAIAAAGVINAQPHRLSAAYTRVIEVGQGAIKWADAEKGSVSGTLKFSAKRPSQPIVVYLVADGGEGEFAAPAAVKFSQKGAKFEPSFAVMVRGQNAEFVNDEGAEIDHNVYFLGAEDLDLGIFEPKTSVSHEFSKAGEVSVHCSIHKLMDAKLFVAPSPAFAEVAGDADKFEIKGVPVGKYTLKTWQKSKRFKEAEVAVEIKKGEAATLEVEMKR